MSASATEVSTLLGHREVETALRCLPTFVRYSIEPVRLRLHDDGTLTDEDLAALGAALPVASVVRRAEADERLAGELRGHPACRGLRSLTPLALKLFDLVVFEPGATVRYVDADVLFLRPFHDPLTDDSDPRPLFFPDDQSAYSLRPFDLRRLQGPHPRRRLNTGVIRFPKHRFDLAALERFLAGWAGYAPQWIEQTCWALLSPDALVLSPGQARIFDPRRSLAGETVALHFVSSVRSGLRDFPEPTASGSPPVRFAILRPRRLGPFTLLVDGVRRRLTKNPRPLSRAPNR